VVAMPCQTHSERLGESRTRWRWLLGDNDGNARGDQDGRGGEHGDGAESVTEVGNFVETNTILANSAHP
jgi:hypothetical protein